MLDAVGQDELMKLTHHRPPVDAGCGIRRDRVRGQHGVWWRKLLEKIRWNLTIRMRHQTPWYNSCGRHQTPRRAPPNSEASQWVAARIQLERHQTPHFCG